MAQLTLAEDGNNQPLLSEKEDVKSARTDQDALPIPVAAPVTGVVGAIDAKIVPNGGEEFQSPSTTRESRKKVAIISHKLKKKGPEHKINQSALP